MNKLVKRGLSAYKVFLKNKLAMSFLMLFSGIMMFIGAINGRGNDTKTLPLIITIGGMVFSFWGLYRLGYIKSNYDKLVMDGVEKDRARKRVLFLQMGEALIYTAIALLGVFLLIDEKFTNKALDLMAGGFTILNGILGAIYVWKNRENKDLRWKLTLILMFIELIVGPYFIFASSSIDIGGYIVMGVLTMTAGTVEVLSALTMANIKSTIKDGKDIVEIMKDDKKTE